MPTDTPRHRLLIVALLAAGFTLGMLPPALGEEDAPPTVLEEVDVSTAALANGSQDVRESRGTLRSPDGGWTGDHRVCGDITFTSVAVSWRQEGGDDVGVTLRWGDEDSLGPALRTVALADEMPDPGVEGSGRASSPVVWTGEARCLELRMEVPDDARISNVDVTLINTSGTATRHTILGSLAAGFHQAMARIWGAPPAEAKATRGPVIRRSGWGADESRRNDWSGCNAPQYAEKLKMAYVHHTVNGNGYSRSRADDLVRSIYAYHTGSDRKYCDIAYNFLVDRFGRIYEGRAGGMNDPVIGGHAMGFNTGSTGVAVIGDFTSHSPPRAVIRALKRLLSWRLDVAHIRPTGRTRMTSGGGSSTKYKAGERVRLPIISGHRQTGYTACPGDKLWAKLRGIRKGAERRGLPKIWKPRASADSLELGSSTVSYRGRLSSTLLWKVKVFDAAGNQVRGWKKRHLRVRATWDGTDKNGILVPPGDYTVTIATKKGPHRARKAVFTTTVTP